MKKYKIVEEYNEKTVVTTTTSFDEAVMTYQAQMDGTSQPAKRIMLFMGEKDEVTLIVDKEL